MKYFLIISLLICKNSFPSDLNFKFKKRDFNNLKFIQDTLVKIERETIIHNNRSKSTRIFCEICNEYIDSIFTNGYKESDKILNSEKIKTLQIEIEIIKYCRRFILYLLNVNMSQKNEIFLYTKTVIFKNIYFEIANYFKISDILHDSPLPEDLNEEEKIEYKVILESKICEGTPAFSEPYKLAMDILSTFKFEKDIWYKKIEELINGYNQKAKIICKEK